MRVWRWASQKTPMQGTVEKPVVENGLVKLALEPSQAVFLVWPKTGTTGILPVADATKRVPPTGTTGILPVASTATETVTPVRVPGKGKGSELAQLYLASWIWHPVNPKAAGKVKFRAEFEAQNAAEATLVFSCDNAAVVFLNGKRVAEQKSTVRSPYDGWTRPTKVKVALKAGWNEVVVDAENPIPGDAGLVASFAWDGGVFTTSRDWEVKREGEEFVKAKRIAGFGSGIWGTLDDKSGVTRSPFDESVATTLSFTLPELKSGERGISCAMARKARGARQ